MVCHKEKLVKTVKEHYDNIDQNNAFGIPKGRSPKDLLHPFPIVSYFSKMTMYNLCESNKRHPKIYL
jgi:hypothetical protein